MQARKTSPSGKRTYDKSAARKPIGYLDLQSLHQIRVDPGRLCFENLLRGCCDPTFGHSMHHRLCPVITIEFSQDMGYMQFDRAQTDP